MRITVVLSTLAVAIALPAAAAGLKDQKQMAEWTAPLTAAVTKFKTKCGYELKATLEPAFSTSDFVKENSNPGHYCAAAITAMATKCSDAAVKSAVTTKIKAFDCAAGTGKDQTLTLGSNKLTYKVGPGATNQDKFVADWLMNNL